jgi:acyl-CoA synthetase (AMP-forming)/AMP-acid ligase II
MFEHEMKIYELSTGGPVTALSPYSSPSDEYRAAFEDREQPFLEYYTISGRDIKKQSLTRGYFWNLACSSAAYLVEHGLVKGERVVHLFSHNSMYDLVFRLAAVLIGYVPVTINWQMDDKETIIYKSKVTEAKLIVYDKESANRIEEIKSRLLPILFLEAEKVERFQRAYEFSPAQLSYNDERIVIFTSGTTAKPKGVSLSHRSYLANRFIQERYFGVPETTQLDLLLVNPLHHANSTAFSDWGMRRGGTKIHLLQRYSTVYWKLLVDVAHSKHGLLIAPLVSRHVDFLENISAQSELPIDESDIKDALSQTELMIGSAPVGPTTVKRILNLSGRLPNVRFGSTETCLQVMATPRTMPKDELMKAFEAGWSHQYKGEPTVGYYIGREHSPFNQVKVVKSIDPNCKGFLKPCKTGEPGYLVTRGSNLMNYYIGDAQATESVFQQEWYTGLRDIVFALSNSRDRQFDYYWMSRDSALIVRGGANYACEPIAAELSKVLTEDFHLKSDQFRLAVVGLRINSEHEDSCCVTIELNPEVANVELQLNTDFIEKAKHRVSKSARPDYVRFAKIPLSFKGEISIPELKQDYKRSLQQNGIFLYEQPVIKSRT